MTVFQNMNNFENLKAKQILPPEAYTSEEWFEREKEELWGRSWAFACMERDIPEIGDYVTVQLGNYPLVVVRDQEENVRVFHNLCRHRGARILEGRGNAAKGMRCRYHYWRFNLDGSVKGIPQQDIIFKDSDCTKDDLSLKTASLGIHEGMIFINAQPEPELTFNDFLDGIKNDGWNQIPADYVEALEVSYEVNANWKLIYENANDGYHLSYLHETTLGGPKTKEQRTVSYGQHSCYQGSNQYYEEIISRNKTTLGNTLNAAFEAMGASEDDQGYLEASEKTAEGANERFSGSYDLYFMFPNLIVSEGALGFMYFEIIPLSCGKTISKFRFFTPPGGEELQMVSNSILMPTPGVEVKQGKNPKPIKLSEVEGGFESRNFQVEDMWICENMHRGMKSPAYEAGPYHPGVGEGPITFFQANCMNYLEPDRLQEILVKD